MSKWFQFRNGSNVKIRLSGRQTGSCDSWIMTHVWHVPYYSTFPPIWTFAHQGDVENVIEWLRIRALHSPDQIESKVSFFGDTMDLEARGGAFDTTPLHTAVMGGVKNINIVLRLIAAGADLSPHSYKGDTPLIELIKKGESTADLLNHKGNEDILTMMKLLLQFGVDVNRACTDTTELEIDWIYGYTALFHAIISFPQAVPMLLEYGADINAKRSIHFARDTPMMVAVMSDRDDCVHLLLEHGADVYASDSFGSTVLEYLDRDKDGNYLPYTENSPASQRVLLLILAEIQRKEVERKAKCVAFAMGKVERLGTKSRVLALDDGVVRMICDIYRV